jgi:hypothetical protein
MTRARLKFDVKVGKKFFKSNIRQKKGGAKPSLMTSKWHMQYIHYDFHHSSLQYDHH